MYAACMGVNTCILGMYKTQYEPRLVIWIKTGACAGLTSVLTLLILFIFFYSRMGRAIILLAFLDSWLSLCLIRLTITRMVREKPWRLMLVGSENFAEKMESLALSSRQPWLIQVHWNIKSPALCRGTEAWNSETMDQLDLEQPVEELIDEVVVEDSHELPSSVQKWLEKYCLRGLQVSLFSAFQERRFFRIKLESVDASWLHHLDLKTGHPFYWQAKRICDIGAAIAGGIISLPFVIIAGLLIKIEDGGPIFYTQARVGKMGRVFQIIKLRTMRTDAEKDGIRWASQKDSRITLLGRILRKTRIDEMPQFWNVLVGEMSLIGPRPERPEIITELEKQIPIYPYRHLIQPGITGWAQINYPYGSTLEDVRNKLSYDLYYLKNASPFLDLQIFLRTVGAMAQGSR